MPFSQNAQVQRDDPAAGRLEAAIGQEVRALRKERGMTVSQLAGAADLSSSMLSKIENGLTSPSLATLSALASVLNVPASRFFQRFEHRHAASFCKSGEGKPVDRRGSRFQHAYALLDEAVGTQAGVEPCLVMLTEQSRTHTGFVHPGQEFIYVLEGEMRYRHGEQTYDMAPGDSLFFDATAPHGPDALIRAPVRLLSVSLSPRDPGA